jgi:hypothetical protein
MISWPDTSVYAAINIALKKPAKASSVYIDSKPDKVVDGDTATAWNSGNYHPAWWEVDLKGNYDIDSINVKLDQTPEGLTAFQAWVYSDDDSMMVARWNGYTKSGAWLPRGFHQPLLGIQRIRICSESSPSWISFFEVRVIGVPSKHNPTGSIEL